MVIFTDPEIAWAGLTEERAKRDGIAYVVAQYPWAASGRAQAVGATAGTTKILTDPETERVLGAGIVGSGALTGIDMAKACVTAFLTTDFAGDRHARRVDKLSHPPVLENSQ